MNQKKNKLGYIVAIILIYVIIVGIFSTMQSSFQEYKSTENNTSEDTFKIISSTENKDIENILQNYAKQNDINLQIDYAGTIEIMEKLNSGEKYDAVWSSNSILLYM